MKKTIISLCIVVAMLISLVPSTTIAASATSIQSDGTTRRLTAVKVYDESNTLTGDYEFHYDGDFLTGVTSRTYGEYAYESSVVLSYDTAGRLVSRISGDPDMPGMNSGSEYTYNSAGQLISSLHWEGGAVEETYEYDSTGKLIRAVENYDAGKTITEYCYNEDGLLNSAIETSTEEWSGDTWSETIAYSYDQQNRLSKVSCTGGYSDTLTTYNYQYQPFILSEYIDSYGYSNTNLLLQDDNGYTLHSFYLSNPELFADSSGYLAKVVDTSSYSNEVQTYVFYYNGVASDVVSDNSTLNESGAWNQVYYDFIIQDRKNADSSEDWEWVGYELVYLDDDTIPEVWITYSSWAAGCRIVSYRDGKLTQELIGSGTLSYEEYGNVFHHSYGHMGLYFDTIFKLDNGKLVTVAEGRNETTVNEDGSQNYDVMNYFWNDTQVSEETYAQNIESLVRPNIAKETSYDNQYSYVEILDYLSSVKIEDVQVEDPESAYEDYARTEWIEQHMEYAASDEYQSEIVGGYNGRMLAVFRDALDDGGIGGYRLAKNTSEILGLDFELSETEMYELILAEILYSRTSLNMGTEAYKENYNKALKDVAKLLVTVANVADGSSKIPKDTLNSINDLYAVLKTLSSDSPDFDSTYSQFVKLIKENVSETDLIKGFKSDATFTAIGIVVDGLFETYDSLEDILQYISNYVAYQSTSQQLKEVLMRLSVVVLYEYEGLYGVEELEELDIWDAMVNWGDFSAAIVSFMTVLADYEQDGAAAVAEYAVERAKEGGQKFGDKAIKSVVVFGLDTIASKIPVLNAIVLAKNVLNVGVLVTEVLTNVDEREYALDMLTKVYCISVALDKVVDDCADAMNENDFYASTVFDESVNVYSGTQLLASDFALKYADMVLANAEEDLYNYDEGWGIDHLFNSREKMVAIVEWYSNSYKMLEEQRSEIQSIACHDSDLSYNQTTDEIVYHFKDSRIYIVACPVSVIVKNEAGEQIAHLSGENNQITEGYEFYFHTIKATDDSDEYIKVAIVPDGYQVELVGTDDGTMNVFVTDFTSGDVGEVETYFNIPIEKDSAGYFEVNSENADENSLVMDQIAYSNMEKIEDIPTNSESNGVRIWIVGGTIACVIILIFIFKKKSRK